MTPEEIRQSFIENLRFMESIVWGGNDEILLWKPGPDKWSILEIVNHLADEEVEDFRTRIRLTLESPDKPWPPIDPEAWVTERNYQARDMDESFERFSTERRESVRWLAGKDNQSWENVHHHSTFGPLSARTLLENWLAHDYLHIRQILTNRWKYLDSHRSGSGLDYAGQW